MNDIQLINIGAKKISQYIFTGYVENALASAKYDKLGDRAFSGRIPSYKGVLAFGKTLRDCEDEFRSILRRLVACRTEIRSSYSCHIRIRFE
jgi:predicted RNase H-like HicB family nuclease